MHYSIMRRFLSQEIEEIETKLLECTDEEERKTLERDLKKRQELFYPAKP